jgi:hypothetical protein
VLESEMAGEVLIEQAERVREFLRRQRGQLAAGVHTGEVARDLTPAVQDQDRAVAVDGQAGRRRVRDVVRDEPHLVRVEPGQCGGEELRCPARVVDP